MPVITQTLPFSLVLVPPLSATGAATAPGGFFWDALVVPQRAGCARGSAAGNRAKSQ